MRWRPCHCCPSPASGPLLAGFFLPLDMRARNLKPKLFKNEVLGEIVPLYTLLFQALWCLADREGRLEDRPKMIKAETFPYRDGIDINGYLTELERLGFIQRYAVDDVGYIQVIKFAVHQSPHHTEKPSDIPPPPKNVAQKQIGCCLTVNTPVATDKITAALPPDSLIPDSLIPDSKPLCPQADIVGASAPDPSSLAPKKNGHHSIAKYLPDAQSVIDYLNNAVDANYPMRNPKGQLTSNAELIVQRLREGYTAKELREVVFDRCRAWKGDEKMAGYLRPSTLFTKRNFEKYHEPLVPKES
jgi:uncharacterized phage protein (TIGR02220 family)